MDPYSSLLLAATLTSSSEELDVVPHIIADPLDEHHLNICVRSSGAPGLRKQNRSKTSSGPRSVSSDLSKEVRRKYKREHGMPLPALTQLDYYSPSTPNSPNKRLHIYHNMWTKTMNPSTKQRCQTYLEDKLFNISGAKPFCQTGANNPKHSLLFAIEEDLKAEGAHKFAGVTGAEFPMNYGHPLLKIRLSTGDSLEYRKRMIETFEEFGFKRSARFVEIERPGRELQDVCVRELGYTTKGDRLYKDLVPASAKKSSLMAALHCVKKKLSRSSPSNKYSHVPGEINARDSESVESSFSPSPPSSTRQKISLSRRSSRYARL